MRPASPVSQTIRPVGPDTSASCGVEEYEHSDDTGGH